MRRIVPTLLVPLLLLCACSRSSVAGEENEETNSSTWQEQYDLGVRYLSEGNYQEAIIAFTAAIEIDPKQAPAYVGRGDAYIGSGETEENLLAAQADYEMAIKLDDKLAEAYLGLADVSVRQEKYKKAIDILTTGATIIENDAVQEKLTELKSFVGPQEIVIGGRTYPIDVESIHIGLGDFDGDLTPLQYCTNLKDFYIAYHDTVTDLSPLAELKTLTSVTVIRGNVVDLTPLSKLEKLNRLELGGNTGIFDIGPLKNLTALTYLDLGQCGKIDDISPLKGLTNLESLYIGGTSVSDLSALEDMKALETLDVSHTDINTLLPLSNLMNLKKLYISMTDVDDLSPLSALPQLEYLNAIGIKTKDASPVSHVETVDGVFYNR